MCVVNLQQVIFIWFYGFIMYILVTGWLHWFRERELIQILGVFHNSYATISSLLYSDRPRLWNTLRQIRGKPLKSQIFKEPLTEISEILGLG